MDNAVRIRETDIADNTFDDKVNTIINDLLIHFAVGFVQHSILLYRVLVKGKFGKLFIAQLFILLYLRRFSQKQSCNFRNNLIFQKFDNFTCENGGIRILSKENGASCWCTRDYVGEHCQTIIEKPVSLMSPIISLFGHDNSDVSRGRPTMWWSIFPFTSELQLKTVYAYHQSAVKRLINVSAGAQNDGYAARILPPAYPLECCRRDEHLPLLDTLYNDIFKRKPGQFIPDQNNRNLLYNIFYQYFVMQFFDANFNLTVTASQLYGCDPVTERLLRSFYGGKLQTLKSKNKHYAPHSSFELRRNVNEKKGLFNWLSTKLRKMIGPKFRQAELLSTSHLLLVLSTLWVREHNRVCDELSRKSPSWTDEELYTTARKIVTGQMMTIMMNEILNVKLRPEVYHHRIENISCSGSPIELFLTMFPASSLPEKLEYNSTKLTSNTRQISEDDLKNTLKFMVNSKMGMVTAHNDGVVTERLTRKIMTTSRENCLQGFNNYRRLLGLPAYKSFFDLTGNNETATELKNLYSTVEDVELLTGVLTERSSSGALPTAEILSNSFIINAILTNNITAKHSWVPDTFGGVEFFDLVKSTSLKSLVYRNMDVNRDELPVHLYIK